MLDVKQIKRFLALLKAEVELNRTHNDIEYPKGFKKSFEQQKHFMGWINYKETWYIGEFGDPWKVILIERPLVDEWHEHLKTIVPVLTPEGEIVTAEEWDQRSSNNGGESNVQ